MERSQPPFPRKSSSFSSSSATREEKLRATDRNLSLGSIRFEDKHEKKAHEEDSSEKPARINEEEEEEEERMAKEEEDVNHGEDQEVTNHSEDTPQSDDLITISDDIDRFLAGLLSLGEREGQDENPEPPPEIPESTIEKFASLAEIEITKYESGAEKLLPEHHDDEPSLLDAVDRISKLTAALAQLSSDPRYFNAMNQTGAVLHHAMSFLEDEFYSLLEESSRTKQDPGISNGKTKRPPSFSRGAHEHDRCVLSPSAEPNPAHSYPSPEIVARLRAIAGAMISAGYDTECCQVFAIARRNAFESGLSDLGFEKIAIDDVQRMAWDSLEGEIAKWIKTFRHAITVSLSLERDLCDSVFSGHPSAANALFRHLASSAIFQLLNFAEAVAMTKRSAEKLFKVLDMYDALRDMIPKIDLLLPCEKEEGEEEEESSSSSADLKSEISSAQSRLGEAAVAIFCDLESSIKSDTGKTPVPGGAVHPLTRYVMNYLKYACEYINTLEQIFKEHKKSDDNSSSSYEDDNSGHGCNGDSSSHASRRNKNNNNNVNNHTPFAAQLIEVMDLLQSNLDSKSKLYKDLALSNIFLMNNGRYVVQKIKGSEINKLLGDTWCRKQSWNLRQYHKNYQRETWSKVLGCFKDEGLTVKGSVSKPVLKERFKSFNSMFEEIHKVQSMWSVSDEQLQSELRVSVSAVVVPAYRSFLGRFQQYLDAGRQTEKYIKFGAEDLENYIDELFDGNPSSMVRRRT